jgi:hypothetical protein
VSWRNSASCSIKTQREHTWSLDLRFEEAPKPMTIAQLNKTSSYGMPDKVVASYFPVPVIAGKEEALISTRTFTLTAAK